jgi:outer membrane protein
MRLRWPHAWIALLALVRLPDPRAISAQAPDSLTLESAVRLAVARAPGLVAAREAVADAAGGVREARALWWPKVGVEGTVNRFEEPMIVVPLHAFDATRLPRFDETLVQGNVALGYTLFDGGQRSGRIGQAVALEAAAGFRAAATEQAVVAAAVRAFTGVLTARGVLDAEDRRIAALEAEANRVAHFLREGRAARVEALRVEAALARARAGRAQAAASFEVAEAGLARLLGVSRERVAALTPLRLVAAPLPPREELSLAARTASPLLDASARRVAAARASVRVARADWYPIIRVEGRAVSYGAGEGGFSTEWQTGLRVSYPLFTGGSRTGAVRRAEAGLRQAEADLRDLRDQVDGQLDEAVARVTEARGRVEALEAAETHLAEVARVEALSLAQGVGVQSDYLRAEADLAQARADLSAARAGEIVAHVEVARLTGRLSPATLRTIVESGR